MNVIGWVSAVFLVGAYTLVATKRISASAPAYHVANFVGAVGLTVFSLYKEAIPSVVLNVFWGAVAVVGIVIAIRAVKESSQPPSASSSSSESPVELPDREG